MNVTTSTLQRVTEIVVEQAGPDAKGQVTPDTHLINDLGFDSLDVMETVMEVEEEFEMTVEEAEIQNLGTVRQITEYIDKRLASGRQVAALPAQ